MSAARLALDLHARACAAFAVSTAENRGPALAALDDFLSAPGPAPYLAAVRALGCLRRARALSLLDRAGAERAFSHGRQEVHVALGATIAAELAPLGEGLESDRRAGDRLLALAALFTARAELATRITADSAALRSRFQHAKEPPPAEGRLAFRGKQKAARAARRARKR